MLDCNVKGHISKSLRLPVSIINHSARNDCVLCHRIFDIGRDPTYDAMGSQNRCAR